MMRRPIATVTLASALVFVPASTTLAVGSDVDDAVDTVQDESDGFDDWGLFGLLGLLGLLGLKRRNAPERVRVERDVRI